ncbi:hypothetical protein TYRP_020331 [Tyrophagus putrescentiae]|nr:hypothetical protein TYRP_020331 [Tyrophagus putrescentiae]
MTHKSYQLNIQTLSSPVQLEQSNFALWLNSLKMVLCAACAVQAVESALPEEDPLNIIARGLILQTVPVELQTPIKQMKVAYEMLQTLRTKYEKTEFFQSSTENLNRKKTTFHHNKSDLPNVKQGQHQMYKEDKQITLSTCEQWRRQLESILSDIRNPVHFYDDYMRKIGLIYRKLKSDAQNPNEPNPQNRLLMLKSAPVQLEQNNFSLWLKSLMMVLSADGAVHAVKSKLPKKHPDNLIACARILQTIPVELQAIIDQVKIAYKMLQLLRHIYEKKDDLSQSSTVNVVRM